MDPRHSFSVSRAESLFASLLTRQGEVGEGELAVLRAEHPELAGELDGLFRQWCAMRSSPGLLVDPHATAPSERASGSSRGISAGTEIDHFRCRRLLGRGGMGEVWEADDLTLKRSVALKLVPLSDSSSRVESARFQREAEAAGRVHHGGVVAVYSAGESQGWRYIAQELVPGGRTLRHLIEESRAAPELPPDHYARVAQLFLELTDALGAAHASGTVHRDLKPQNILLGPDGRPKVADFGLAMVAGDASLSTSGEFVGTWLYASPEQVQGSARVDASSDVFSLGATLYECLTLRRPFEGDAVPQLVRQITTEDPPDPRSLRSRVPSDLALIALEALQKRPQERYASMREFHEDLRRHLAHEPILAREPTLAQRVHKWIRRRPTAATALALSFAAFAVTVVLWLRAERARAAERESNRALLETNLELDASRKEAQKSAEAASASAREARAESESREQVIGFLLELFANADPEQSGGENPSARELVARGVERLGSIELSDDRVRARILRTLAMVNEKLGDLDQARRLADQAALLWEQVGERDHPDYLETRIGQGLLLFHAGDLDAAERLLADVAAEVHADPELERELGWNVEDALGAVYASSERFAEAERSARLAVELERTSNQRRPNDQVTVETHLADVYLRQGRLEEAEQVLRPLAERVDRLLSPANPAALGVWNSLGLVLHERQRYAEAEEIFQRAVQIGEESLPHDHYNLLTSRMNLARAWQELARYSEAEALYRDLLALSIEKRGRDAPDTLTIQNNLSTCLQRQNRYAEAEVLQREILEVCREAVGPDHPETLRYQNNLAATLFFMERYEEALELQEEVVQRTPPDHPNLGGRRRVLADIRAKLADTAPSADPPGR